MINFHPQSPFLYKVKIEVEAVQWNGHNLDEMKKLLDGVVDSNEYDGPEVYVDEIEPFFLPLQNGKAIAEPAYNMLKFYAGDDMEVDPGQWVVVYSDGEVEVMEDQQFTKMFGPA